MIISLFQYCHISNTTKNLDDLMKTSPIDFHNQTELVLKEVANGFYFLK